MIKHRFAILCVTLLCGAACVNKAHAHARPWEVTALMRVEPIRVTCQLYTGFGLVDKMLHIDRRDPETLSEAELDQVKRQIADRFAELVRVEINGEVVPPRIDTLYIGRDMSMPDVDKTAPTFPADNADVSIVVTYPTIDPPKTVSVRWAVVPAAYFDADVIKAIERTQPLALLANVSLTSMGQYRRHIVIGPKPGTFTVDNDVPAPQPVDLAVATRPVTVAPHGPAWSAFVVLTMLLGGAILIVGFRSCSDVVLALACVVIVTPLVTTIVRTHHVDRPAEFPDAERARVIARQLLRNVYLAGMYTRDDDVYDLLARSVSGDYLDELYHQLYAVARRAESPDGASTDVLSVEVLDCDVKLGDHHATHDEGDASGGDNAEAMSGAFEATLRWRVRGIVKHFNHVHTRTNEYTAVFTVAPNHGSWRFVAGEPLGATRVVDEVTPGS
ncbi:MAG: hypothetical protein GC159_05330 [Phycisphaera sp.]|nr:hypothetical protein [Phycisphaera sp.]